MTTGVLSGIRTGVTRSWRRAIAPQPWWFPPIRRREFWVAQILVVAIAAGHAGLEITGRLAEPTALYLIPTSLFVVPVVYAALSFGVRGSLPTALWSTMLTLPNLILWHTSLSRIGAIWQAVLLLSFAIFVGIRVDAERNARQAAEDRERARRSAEARYRALFDNASEAVLVIDRDGCIEEANAAAARLLDRPIDLLRGVPLDSIVGRDMAAALLAGQTPSEALPLTVSVARQPVWVELLANDPPADRDGGIHLQAVLHNVTHQHERQQDLEDYARRALAAREEEQRRIGRELHDGPLQSLVLLARDLDLLHESMRSGEAVGTVAQARARAEETADELRRISRALRPSVLDDLGLTAALKSEGSALAHRSGISVRFVRGGRARSLESDTELMLLRVTQEALHNVERHSRATRVMVRLAFHPEKVSLSIRDDGTGLGVLPSTSELLAAGKLGIVGMQERARLVQADIVIRSLRQGGTSIEITVPLERGAKAD